MEGFMDVIAAYRAGIENAVVLWGQPEVACWPPQTL